MMLSIIEFKSMRGKVIFFNVFILPIGLKEHFLIINGSAS